MKRTRSARLLLQSVFDFLHASEGTRIIEDLRSVGVQMQSTTPAAGRRRLEGKALVVTGSLTNYTRQEIKQLIIQHGGHAASSVSKNTDYLVVGENAGTKLAKAQQLAVKIIEQASLNNCYEAEYPEVTRRAS